eukprot:g18719.t1
MSVAVKAFQVLAGVLQASAQWWSTELQDWRRLIDKVWHWSPLDFLRMGSAPSSEASESTGEAGALVAVKPKRTWKQYVRRKKLLATCRMGQLVFWSRRFLSLRRYGSYYR